MRIARINKKGRISQKMSLSIYHKPDVLLALHYVRAKWRAIGTCLKVKDGDLEAIEAEPGDVDSKLGLLVTRWLNDGQNCTWTALATALKNPIVDRPGVAREIEKTHLGLQQVESEASAPLSGKTKV